MKYLQTFMSKEDQDVTTGISQQKDATPVVEDFFQKKQQSAMLNRLLGQGTYESFDMRCMVTGQFGVGKSTLVKLLVGDAIPDERVATDGISLLEGRCGLDIDTREWVLIDPETYNALDVVYNKVLMTSVAEDESQQDDKPEASRTGSKITGDVSQQLEATKSTSSPEHIIGDPSQQSLADQALLLQQSSSMHLTKEESKKEMKTKMTKDEIRKRMEEILKSGKYKMKVGRLIIWDFGGQYVYYTTHQTFMTFRALFLLVFDGSKGLHDQVLDVLCFPGQHMIPTPAVYLQHWVNSILTYCKPVYKDKHIPKILFVATHKDKIKEDNVETQRKELYSAVEELFKDHEGKQHLVLSPQIFVNAKDKADPDIEVLKRAITDLTFKHPSWGEKMPNAFVPLELEIAAMVVEGIQILSLIEVEELNAISQVSILSPEQLNTFLHFHHSLGRIVYFDTPQLRDFVIISPLLLVEVMRKRTKKTEPCLEYTDLTDDSGEDDTYKPTKENIYSSDSISDAESIQNIKLIRKQRKRNYRNKDWKRKGKTLKHIQSKKRKIVAVVKNKKNRSGTWTQQDKQPITSNSQSPRASSVIKSSRKIEENRRVVVQYHTIRLNNLLLSNNLKRVPIAADENCSLKAVLQGLQEGNSDLNVEKMRKDLVEHLQHERAHYNNF
ncbi:unnamed protein product [Mytilus coruscus]|uniref:C-terminal of Roc (COR) domain-containing protein n=1 Tax=Mytilus coruscus TaxID=42192 RepID=A0A6J8D5T1_MYTCO|nr:unnamed protein product [Mytilus coruscus]